MANPKFCCNCGEPYALNHQYPIECISCNHTVWGNPIPVAVAIQPIYDKETGRTGLAICQRADNEQWALIGGFVDRNDPDIIKAAAREFLEETNVYCRPIGHIDSSYLTSNHNMVFGVSMHCAIDYETYKKGEVCEENLALGVMWSAKDVDLCFPSHVDMAQAFFEAQELSKHVHYQLTTKAFESP